MDNKEARNESARIEPSRQRAFGLTGENLFVQVATQIRAAARDLLRKQAAGHTLQPTALVNEAFLRLFGGEERDWADEKHLIATASTAMRQVLIDHARRSHAEKRRPVGERLALDSIVIQEENRTLDVLALNEALEDLGRFDPTMAKAVELRYFVGLELPEIAKQMEINVRTLQRRWIATRAWLFGRLQ